MDRRTSALPASGGLVLLVALAGCAPGTDPSPTVPSPAHVGSSVCARCHVEQTELWRGSHHDLAMQEASAATVLGDFDDAEFFHGEVTSTFFRRNGKFFVRTDGPEGDVRDFEIAYAFGVQPLQQYLIEFPLGRYQALSIAWDTRPEAEGGRRWFHLYPDERVGAENPLHWTNRLQNWNLMCAECHSTGLEKNYRQQDDRYETSWSEIDVACEACHGPGSRHVEWAEDQDSRDPSDNDMGLAVRLGDEDGVFGSRTFRAVFRSVRRVGRAGPKWRLVPAATHDARASRRATSPGGRFSTPIA